MLMSLVCIEITVLDTLTRCSATATIIASENRTPPMANAGADTTLNLYHHYCTPGR